MPVARVARPIWSRDESRDRTLTASLWLKCRWSPRDRWTLTAWSVTTQRSWVIDQAWTWWIRSTPSMFSVRSVTSALTSSSAGDLSSSMWPASNTTRQAPRRMIRVTRIDKTGSAGIHPVRTMIPAATSAATEPSRSPQHMQHCAAHVQVMIVCTSAVKDQERDNVHDQSGRSDNRHDGDEYFD